MSLIWQLDSSFDLDRRFGLLLQCGDRDHFYSMGRVRLAVLIKEHRRCSRALQALLDNPNNMITALLIANNFMEPRSPWKKRQPER